MGPCTSSYAHTHRHTRVVYRTLAFTLVCPQVPCNECSVALAGLMEAQAPINIYRQHSRSPSERGKLSPASKRGKSRSCCALPMGSRLCHPCSGRVPSSVWRTWPSVCPVRHPGKGAQVGLHSQGSSGSFERKHFNAAAAGAEWKGSKGDVII